MPTALITGASSGIGSEFARELSKRGYNLILASRRENNLRALAEELPGKIEIIPTDLSDEEQCRNLYERCKDCDIEILINNAGFGLFGEFCRTNPDTELDMINVNVRAVHILTKLFLEDFTKKNKGRILNVASAAAFMPAGPLMAAYYASKAYVLSLTEGIAKELKKQGSKVTVSALCPGPVKTEFNSVAGVKFAYSGISAKKAAICGVRGMFRGKTVIIPGIVMKIGKICTKILPDKVLAAFAYRFQSGKNGR